MKIARFEDLEVWQHARHVCRSVYRLTREEQFSRDFGLRDQMRRASVSVMANIAEGFSRRGDKEFCRFLFVAKGSAAELQSHAYVALDQTYLVEEQFNEVYLEVDRLSRMLSGLITYLLRAQKPLRSLRSGTISRRRKETPQS